MWAEVRGAVPKLPFEYARKLVSRAWTEVRQKSLWSFQLFDGSWASPPLLTGTGTATCTLGSSSVTLDATALTYVNAQLAAQPYSLITQRQFRVGVSTVYNIWAFDSVGGVLSLDRPWMEASTGAVSTYNIFQCYYVPTQAAGSSLAYLSDFRTWISVRNLQNFIDLYTDRYTRADLDALDPQRYMNAYFPTDVVPYTKDNNPASATYGYQMFELWGTPLAFWTFQLLGIRRGADLVNPTDTLPSAVGEDLITAKARVYAYEWAEANKGSTPRNVGSDFRFLMGAADKEFTTLLQRYRKDDREQVDNFFTRFRTSGSARFGSYYNSISGVASTSASW